MSRTNELAKKVGMGEDRAGSYFLENNSVVMETIEKAYEGKIEIMDIRKALEKYEWAKKLRWSLVDPEKDEYTRAAKKIDGGYFIRIKKGAHVTIPLQSCMMISSDYTQKVHNLIIAEEGSKAEIVTGCVTHPSAISEHIGISEFFIRKNAELNFTMIHSWNKTSKVRPRSAAVIEDNAHFLSNYICMNPVKDIQMYPRAVCRGENSRVSFSNLIAAPGNSLFDVGSEVVLEGRGSRGEVISRAIAKDSSSVIARGRLIGNRASRAHLECKGILMSDDASITAIPELISKSSEAELSHEAAVGKIAQKEIEYLMTRGLNEDEAVSTIVRGFMDTSIMGLPKELERSVNNIMDQVSDGF